MRRIIWHDPVFQDLDEASAYIGEHNPRASVRFLEAAQDAFAQLADTLGLGTIRDFGSPEFAGMRMFPVPGFSNYLIYYLNSPDMITIVRVLHGARDATSLFTPDAQQ